MAGTGGDVDTAVEVAVAPVRVVISDDDQAQPTSLPQPNPTNTPTMSTFVNPVTSRPIQIPSGTPSFKPSIGATFLPSLSPVTANTKSPSTHPVSMNPIVSPTKSPLAISPTKTPVKSMPKAPSLRPSRAPVQSFTKSPSSHPVMTTTLQPSARPSTEPKILTISPNNPITLPTSMPSIPTTSPVTPYCVTLGDSDGFISLSGDTWMSDIFNSGSTVDECASSVLSGVADRGLYCAYRQWGFSTTGPLLLPSTSAGYYKVALHFTETSAVPGERVVDIFVNGYRISPILILQALSEASECLHLMSLDFLLMGLSTLK